jgi:uncharacterized DUF497 family protein
LRFIWDAEKDARNWLKHGVRFSEAATAFDDPLSRTVSDGDHSHDELRFILLGFSSRGRLLVVARLERDSFVRIISARCANRRERRTHEEEV